MSKEMKETKPANPASTEVQAKNDIIRQLERLSGELNGLILAAAMENARLVNESKAITDNIEMLKFFNEKMIIETIDLYRNNPEQSIWAEAGDPNGKPRTIKGKIKDVIGELLDMHSHSIERTALIALKDSMQSKAKPLSLSLEEVRKTALKLRALARPDLAARRRSWTGKELELAMKPLSNQRMEFLSFDLGGLEFAEEFGYVKEILGYQDYIDTIKAQQDQLKITVTDWLTIDRYVDLYELCGLVRPDLSEMQIVVLNFLSYDYAEKPYTVTKNHLVALPVDCVNYPFSTRPGKSFGPSCAPELESYLLDCWSWIKKYCSDTTSVEKVEREQLYFLDWPKILAAGTQK